MTPGTRIGDYRVTALLGAGGMGEVYRATDEKLKREVAIKVLPDMFSADGERLARFQREARTLAALNHPNVGAIYGFEDTANLKALVPELVDGPTLADRAVRRFYVTGRARGLNPAATGGSSSSTPVSAVQPSR
jgi:serine/threonine protein kinase